MFRWHLGVSDEGAMYQQDLFDFGMNDDQLPKLSRLGHCQKKTICFFKEQFRLFYLDVSPLFHRSFGSMKSSCHLLLLLQRPSGGDLLFATLRALEGIRKFGSH